LRFVEESYRGRSVRIFRMRSDRAIASLRERAERLLSERPDVVQVRLFGSLARGSAKPGSDADLVVIVTAERGVGFLERIADLQPHFAGVGIGCDLLVYTEGEWDRLRREGRRLARTVEQEGLILASR
jgi:predicted nucleotidyltransferase